MSRRPLFLLPVVLAAIAVPTSPALAGGGDDDGESGAASATLRAPQGCVSGERARTVVTGELIDSVAFHLDGDLVTIAQRPNANGEFSMRVRCADLRLGAHRGKAVVRFENGASPASRTLRFQLTRSRQGTPRFAG